MTEQLKQAKRLIGRVDRVESKPGGAPEWGFIVTEDWTSYFWHVKDVEHKRIGQFDVVSFEAAPAKPGSNQLKAVAIRVEKEKASPEFFGKFARFIRERNEEVA